MRQQFGGTADIVIPTGRGGFCCILPCALLVTLYTMIGCGAFLLVRHAVRRRHPDALDVILLSDATPGFLGASEG